MGVPSQSGYRMEVTTRFLVVESEGARKGESLRQKTRGKEDGGWRERRRGGWHLLALKVAVKREGKG